MKLVYIEWQDAHTAFTLDDGWQSKEKVDEFCDTDEFVVHHVGWIYRENKKYIVLVNAYVPDGKFIADGYGGVIKIPKGWIRKRQTIKLDKA